MKLYSLVLYLALLLIYAGNLKAQNQRNALRISVIDLEQGTPIADAYLVFDNILRFTNELGIIFIENPKESKIINACITKLGYSDTCFLLPKKGFLEIALRKNSILLLEAQVSHLKESKAIHLLRSKILKTTVSEKDFNLMHSHLGEEDYAKLLQQQAGIQSGVVGGSSIQVRGNDHYNNYIQLDGVPIYNTVHLFGLTSPMPSAAIESVDLYKQGVPAEHNNGSGSIINYKTKSAKTEYKASLGLGISSINGHFSTDVLDKNSIMLSVRSGTLGPALYLNNMLSGDDDQFMVDYQDIILKFSRRLSSLERLSIVSYYSRDRTASVERSFDGAETITERNPSNLALGIIYERQLERGQFLNLTTYFSDYHFQYNNERTLQSLSENLVYDYSFKNYGHKGTFRITQGKGEILLGYDFGVWDYSSPEVLINGSQNPTGKNTSLLASNISLFYCQKVSLLNESLLIDYGLRIQTQQGLANYYDFLVIPRFLTSLKINNNSAIFVAFDHLTQPFHRIRQGLFLSQQDFILPISSNLPSSQTFQLSLGQSLTYKDFVEFSAVIFYRKLQNQVDRDFNYPTFNATIEQNGRVLNDPSSGLLTVNGESYGLELTAGIEFRRLVVNSNYSYIVSNRNSPEINGGESYPYSFNRNHVFNVSSNYRFRRTSLNKIIHLHVSWTFSSGNNQQFPLSFFRTQNPITRGTISIPVITERNNLQLPSFHYLDFSIRFIKEGLRGARTLSLGVNNAYNSHIPYTFVWNTSNKLGTESFLPVIPALTYKYQWK